LNTELNVASATNSVAKFFTYVDLNAHLLTRFFYKHYEVISLV